MTPTPDTVDFHRESHRDLLVPADALVGPAAPARRPPVDVIVVPAGRPASYLREAMALAAGTGCPLVVLCSRRARAAGVARAARAHPGLECHAVDVRRGFAHPLLAFAASAHPAVAGRTSDLSVKRSLGLLLARHLGWTRVLFLDDDIRGLTPGRLADMAAHLGRPVPGAGDLRTTVVGLRVTDYCDNSVVCHAHRAAGGHQDVFVSGSVLLVEVRATTPFFPQVYNEDWLFLLDDVRRGTVAVEGEARQLAYDPYADPARAASEEFGDVLAEGLMTELHRDPTIPRVAADPAFWHPVLARRAAFVADVLDRTDDPRVRRALRAAADRLATIRPEDCASWVELWQDDLTAWEPAFAALGRVSSVAEGFRELGLEAWPAAVRRPWGRPRSGRATAHPLPPVAGAEGRPEGRSDDGAPAARPIPGRVRSLQALAMILRMRSS